MNEQQAWSQRLAQLNEKCPDLLAGDRRGETILYIGATPWRFQMAKELHEAGYEITLLEAFGPYAKNYEGHPWVTSVVNDVVEGNYVTGLEDGVFDGVVWWHGPEHVEESILADTLEQLERVASRWVVLACPWGENVQGWVDNNPYEQHRAILYTDHFRALNYETGTLGRANDPSTWSQVLAWKEKEARGFLGSYPRYVPGKEQKESVVYTANIGRYDDLTPPVPWEGNGGLVPHICFGDKVFESVDGWEQVPAEIHQCATSRNARRYKALSHLYFREYGWSIWMDAHGKLKVHPRCLTELLGDRDIGVFLHPVRDCVYDEASAVVELGKDEEGPVMCQMSAYRDAGYPVHRGLAATGLVVRRHTPDVARFNEAWWAQISTGSVRDQLSFDYVCWMLDIKYAVLPGNLWDNGLIEWHGHR